MHRPIFKRLSKLKKKKMDMKPTSTLSKPKIGSLKNVGVTVGG